MDPLFAPDTSALFWEDAGESNRTGASPNADWGRAFGWNKAACLLGKDAEGADEMDINQGQIGNCWVLAAASSYAYKDNRAERLFLNSDNELKNSGIHAFNMYSLGVPHVVVVDDKLPMRRKGLVFAK